MIDSGGDRAVFGMAEALDLGRDLERRVLGGKFGWKIGV